MHRNIFLDIFQNYVVNFWIIIYMICSAIVRKKWVLEKSPKYWHYYTWISYVVSTNLTKIYKSKLDIAFLKKCKSADVYPKFIRWKNVKNKTKKEKNKFYRATLNNAIKARQWFQKATKTTWQLTKPTPSINCVVEIQ